MFLVVFQSVKVVKLRKVLPRIAGKISGKNR